jgi:hypothetical protein
MGMELTNSKTQIIIAIIGLVGVLGGALFANWEKVFPRERSARQEVSIETSPAPPKDEGLETGGSTTTSSQQAELKAASQPNIGGVWRDAFGGIYNITQSGNRFEFTTSNPGNGYASRGSGTINERTVESVFKSNLPSTGSGTGTISADGKQITGTCYDSTLGQYVLTLYR